MNLLIADSVCGGFGQPNKKSFVHFAFENLNLPLTDHSANGMSSQDYLRFLATGEKISKEQEDVIEKNCEINILVLALGNIDCRVKFQERNWGGKIVPNRYRKEKFDPRPYFSKRILKKLPQHIDNYFRAVFRWYSAKTGNIEYYVTREVFESNCEFIIKRYHPQKLIIVSTSAISDRLFPRGEKSFQKADEFLDSLAKAHQGQFFNLKPLLTPGFLMLDEFHLNQVGHKALSLSFKKLLET